MSLVSARELECGVERRISYETARIPTRQTTYTFSPQSFNSMLLLPPPEAQNTRPIYHISVAMNCFIPSSYVTTLRRGASEYGDCVAEFEYVSILLCICDVI